MNSVRLARLLRCLAPALLLALVMASALLTSGCGGSRNTNRSPENLIVFFEKGTTEAERAAVYAKHDVEFVGPYLDPSLAPDAYIVLVAGGRDHHQVAAQLEEEQIVFGVAADTLGLH